MSAETVEVDGRDLAISNGDKLFFPERGITKRQLIDYYLAVGEGALTGCFDRPSVLKRYPNGAAGPYFFQKRAPVGEAGFLRTTTVQFPSGRSAALLVIDSLAALLWSVNLGCIDINPWPVRSGDTDHPDELRVDLDPQPDIPFSDIRRVALVVREVLEEMGLKGYPKTSGSRGIHVNVRIVPEHDFTKVRRAALALAREVERRAPALATSKWWKEERHGVFIDYNQNAKDRTVASAYSVRPVPDARVSAPVTWDELPDCELGDFTLATVPGRFARVGDPGAGIDEAVGSLDALLELAARQQRDGLGDAPWPPHYAKAPGEPPRVMPSRARGNSAASPAPPAASRVRAADPSPSPSPSRLRGNSSASEAAQLGGRRVSTKPLVEIARAATKEEALAGFARWRGRHAAIVGYLQPADILVDGMRGRFTLLYRIRVNLQHVPEAERPPQEPLDAEYDPWGAMR